MRGASSKRKATQLGPTKNMHYQIWEGSQVAGVAVLESSWSLSLVSIDTTDSLAADKLSQPRDRAPNMNSKRCKIKLVLLRSQVEAVLLNRPQRL